MIPDDILNALFHKAHQYGWMLSRVAPGHPEYELGFRLWIYTGGKEEPRLFFKTGKQALQWLEKNRQAPSEDIDIDL